MQPTFNMIYGIIEGASTAPCSNFHNRECGIKIWHHLFQEIDGLLCSMCRSLVLLHEKWRTCTHNMFQISQSTVYSNLVTVRWKFLSQVYAFGNLPVKMLKISHIRISYDQISNGLLLMEHGVVYVQIIHDNNNERIMNNDMSWNYRRNIKGIMKLS